MAPRIAATRLTFAILLPVLVGGFIVAYLWETMNRLASGIVEPLRLLLALPALIGFAILLRYMARAVDRWHGEPGQ
jgi:hypothetical protein